MTPCQVSSEIYGRFFYPGITLNNIVFTYSAVQINVVVVVVRLTMLAVSPFCAHYIHCTCIYSTIYMGMDYQIFFLCKHNVYFQNFNCSVQNEHYLLSIILNAFNVLCACLATVSKTVMYILRLQ